MNRKKRLSRIPPGKRARRRYTVARVMCIGIFIAGFGCGSGDGEGKEKQTAHLDENLKLQVADSTAVQQAEVFRGSVLFGHEVRSFRPCGSEDELWVVDRTGVLWDLLRELAPLGAPDREVFAMVKGHRGPPPEEGFGAEYPGRLTVEEILYVAREGFNCTSSLGRFAVHAYGNEPFWSIHVSEKTMHLTRPGEPDLTWRDVVEYRSETDVRYTAGTDSISTVELVILREPCRDSMSGAYYACSAILRLESGELRGCAFENWFRRHGSEK